MKKLTIKTANQKLQSGEITSVQLTEYYLGRIKEENPRLNAYLSVFEESAIAEAQKSDERRRNHQTFSELDGIPLAIKDNIVIKDTITTAASKMLENFVSSYDATVISKLKSSGAVILGKTNLDEFAMGSSTENSAYGVTKNPHDLSRVAGGSSGGSAVAVAADLCVAALGSDTFGSIRLPASFCGIVGFKPTYGAVSRYGLIAMSSSFDQIGPMTKTAEDSEIIYRLIAGDDEKDSTNMKESIKGQVSSIKELKLGVPKEYFGEGLSSEVRQIIEQAIERFKKLGAEIVDISLPNQKYAVSCYYIIMPVEVSSNLARYDGVKYGYSEIKNQESNIKNLIENYLLTRANGFGEEAKRRIMLGTFASSKGYADKYYHQAQKVRTLIKEDFDRAFEQVDFIIGPVSPAPAFKIGEKVSNPLEMYLSDIYTGAANLGGLPAMSIPAGNSDSSADGLPVGLHIIGPQWSDDKIIEIAKEYQEKIRISNIETLPTGRQVRNNI